MTLTVRGRVAWPPAVTATIAVHAVYGVIVAVLLPHLPTPAPALQPALIMAWTGTATMIAIGVMILAAAGWPARDSWWLPPLLLPDLAAVGLVLVAVPG
jgi:hypothetical protein